MAVYVKFYYYKQRLQKLYYVFTVEHRIFLAVSRDQRRHAEAEWTVIRRIFGIRGRTADLS